MTNLITKSQPDESSEQHLPYKPKGLNRLLWLAAKNIAIPDPEFGYKDLVLFAMSCTPAVSWVTFE